MEIGNLCFIHKMFCLKIMKMKMKWKELEMDTFTLGRLTYIVLYILTPTCYSPGLKTDQI